MSPFKNSTIHGFTSKFALLFNQRVSFDFETLRDDRRFHRLIFRLVLSFLFTGSIFLIPFLKQFGYFSSFFQTGTRLVPLLQMCLSVFSMIAGFSIFKSIVKDTRLPLIPRGLPITLSIALLFVYSLYDTIRGFSSVYYGSASALITVWLLYEFLERLLIRRHALRNEPPEGEESPTERRVRLFCTTLSFIIIIVVIPCFVIYAVWLKTSFDQILLRIASLLVVAGPGSLLFSVHLTKISVLNLLKKCGILIRESTAFRKLVDAYVFMFMKTGVLTEGLFVVKDIEFSTDLSTKPTEVLKLIGSLEQKSSHPIAKAFLDQLKPPKDGWFSVENFVIREGLGIEGSIGDRIVRAGRRELFQNVDYTFIRRAENEERNGNVVVFMGCGDKVYGIAILADTLRPGMKDMAQSLHDLRKLVCILSGDSLHSVKGIAGRCGIENYVAEATAGEKCIEIRNHQRKERSVAILGDIRTDAEVIKQADVRIILKMKTDPEDKSADVIVRPENLRDLPVLIKFARNIFSVVHINSVWIVWYNIGAILLSFLGWIHPITGAIIMISSNILMVICALKLKSFLKY